MSHDGTGGEPPGHAGGSSSRFDTTSGGPEGLSDEELARRAQSRDGGAFDALVRRYRQRLCRFARWYTAGTPNEAEDVAQDILVEVFRSLPSFRGQSRFSTWLFGVARNVCRKAFRNARAGGRWVFAQPGEDGPLDEIPDASLDPLLALERSERRSLVWSAIRALSPEQRSVLVLREMEGFRYDEIAESLGIPAGTVRSRLHNGRATLVRRLAELGMGEGIS
jgi:RNA polymerase sigma-70 factor (ECF subfamily)